MTYTIISAAKLSSANQKAAIKLAEAKLGVSGTPQLEVDPSLIAGVRIVAGSTLLDLSLAGKLDRLTSAIS